LTQLPRGLLLRQCSQQVHPSRPRPLTKMPGDVLVALRRRVGGVLQQLHKLAAGCVARLGVFDLPSQAAGVQRRAAAEDRVILFAKILEDYLDTTRGLSPGSAPLALSIALGRARLGGRPPGTLLGLRTVVDLCADLHRELHGYEAVGSTVRPVALVPFGSH